VFCFIEKILVIDLRLRWFLAGNLLLPHVATHVIKTNDTSRLSHGHSCAPVPFTPTLSPRRGRTIASPCHIDVVSTWYESAAPSPWREQGWVRGNGIDARQRTSRRQLDLPH